MPGKFDVERAFAFLSRLRKNNDRAFFEENRDEWKEISADFEALVGRVYAALADLDPGLRKIAPKSVIFRLNRDVRFSKDKTPYKTQLSAAISSAGKAPEKPGGYIAIGPGGESGAGSGLHAPDKDDLEKLRKAIDRDGAALAKLLRSPPLSKRYDGLSGESYARVPKPWDADHPHAELLRHKSFFVMRAIPDKELLAGDADRILVDHLRAAEPLRAWIVRALR